LSVEELEEDEEKGATAMGSVIASLEDEAMEEVDELEDVRGSGVV
jgi:hypothetical protein